VESTDIQAKGKPFKRAKAKPQAVHIPEIPAPKRLTVVIGDRSEVLALLRDL
jgi:hypothetical protein